MSRPHPQGAWFSKSWIAVPVVVVVTSLLPGVVSAAPSQSVSDLQQQAAQIASQLDQMNTKSSQLDEQYNETEIQLQQLSADLASSRQAVAQAKAELDKHKSTAKSYAVEAYMSGGQVDDLVDNGKGNDAISRRHIYLSAVNGDRQQVIADVTSSEQDLHQRETAVKKKSDEISAKKDSLQQSKTALQATIDQQQKLQSSVKGQLADAVAKEQARREAAAAAAAQAAADAAAKAQAAAAAKAQVAAATAVAAPVSSISSTSKSTTTAGKGAGPNIAAPKAAAPSFPTGSFPVPSALPAGAAGAIAAARSQLGVPYHWAMSSPGVGFDCSGLVMWAYGRVGVSLPHSSSGMYAMTQRISMSQLQPGDLVFNGSPVHHVGIYVGGGQMIHAPHTGTVVQISPIGYAGSVSFGRI